MIQIWYKFYMGKGNSKIAKIGVICDLILLPWQQKAPIGL